MKKVNVNILILKKYWSNAIVFVPDVVKPIVVERVNEFEFNAVIVAVPHDTPFTYIVAVILLIVFVMVALSAAPAPDKVHVPAFLIDIGILSVIVFEKLVGIVKLDIIVFGIA